MSASTDPLNRGNWLPGSLAAGTADSSVDEIGAETSRRQVQPRLGIHERSGVRHSEPSDDQLIAFARFGDHRAFTELWLRYSGSVMKTILRIVRNQEDAEDVLQECVLRAFKSLGGFRGTCSFHTWITRIGINESLMVLRKRRRRRSEVAFDSASFDQTRSEGFDYPDTSLNPEQLCSTRQMSHRVREAARRLPPNLRLVVERYYGEDCTMAEAAGSLGLTLPAAKARLFRARRLLHSFLNS
ncbi:MAG: RNA polymerase sigma factor [Terracidiphilus sp.]